MATNKSKKHTSAHRIKRSGPKKAKTLPPINHDISLRKYGYSLQNTKDVRSKSLKRASKSYGTLKVLRHLNLVRNYSSSVPINYKKLSNDVNFMKKEYSRSKKVKKSKKE